uniref:Uncharacterized protein n=1 Tax=Hyaloperonospora arabidopsidis (strain Emoy2) TaxID=559515 RepID=M4B4F1_HYAAE
MERSVDYGSDTSVWGDARTMSDTPMSEVHPPTTLSPFAERDDAIITNPLDEQQNLAVQRDESVRRHAQMVTILKNQRDYVFNPLSVGERLRQTTGQTLETWTIGETEDEEDNDFIRWVQRTLRPSSMYALRASANVADVRLKCKLRYDYAKLKARGQCRNRMHNASATKVAASAGQTVTTTRQPTPLVVGNGLEGESHTFMSSPTPGTHSTSPDIGIGHDDDVATGVSPHGTGGSLAHREASVEVGVPKEGHEKVLLELNGLRDTLGKTQSALDATQAYVQVLESGHTRMETQLDLLIRMQQPMARPTSAA